MWCSAHCFLTDFEAQSQVLYALLVTVGVLQVFLGAIHPSSAGMTFGLACGEDAVGGVFALRRAVRGGRLRNGAAVPRGVLRGRRREDEHARDVGEARRDAPAERLRAVPVERRQRPEAERRPVGLGDTLSLRC